jgi:hypothetical protein
LDALARRLEADVRWLYGLAMSLEMVARSFYTLAMSLETVAMFLETVAMSLETLAMSLETVGDTFFSVFFWILMWCICDCYNGYLFCFSVFYGCGVFGGWEVEWVGITYLLSR